jgi:hypothetical protein
MLKVIFLVRPRRTKVRIRLMVSGRTAALIALAWLLLG